MEIGMKFSQTKPVTDSVTAASFGEGLMPVLATPYLIAFLEDTAARCVEGELPEGQITLGTMVNVKHLSAAPVGEVITPIRFGKNGMGFLWASSNNPWAASRFFICSKAAASAPAPSGSIRSA